MGKIRILDPIIEAGLPTIKLAVEIRTKASPDAAVDYVEALELAYQLQLQAVNLRTEAPAGKKIKTGFHRLRLEEFETARLAIESKLEEFDQVGLRVALMESSTIDNWNAIAGVVERFGRLVLAGEVNLTPGLTHRDAMTSGKADPAQIRSIENNWHGSDRARLYRLLKEAGRPGIFYEVICVDKPKRILFYDIAKDVTNLHRISRGPYQDGSK
jgi:hypothetical protein